MPDPTDNLAPHVRDTLSLPSIQSGDALHFHTVATFTFFLWLHHIITIIIFTPKYCYPNHIFFLVRRCLVSFQETRRQHFSLSRECKSDMKLPRNLYKFKVWLGEWTIEIQDIKVESIHCKIACWWLVESLLNLTRQANQRLSG